MDKKIAFFDIDGTLVNVPKGLMHPTSETIHALAEFKKLGHKIVVATARGEAPQSVQDIEFDGYICSDGHYIRYNGETLVDELFSSEQILCQLNVYQKYHGHCMFNGHDGEWCSCLDDELVIKHRKMFQGTSERPHNVCEDFTEDDVKAISCCVLFDTVEQLQGAYHELKDKFTMVLYETGLIRMDVYCKGHTKGTACQYLYQKLGIDYENTYAFGDGINDMKMLQIVKHGIAMGNAIEELKAVASEVTETVDDNGIAKAFYRHFGI